MTSGDNFRHIASARRHGRRPASKYVLATAMVFATIVVFVVLDWAGVLAIIGGLAGILLLTKAK